MRGDVQYEPVSVSAASAVGSAVAATTQLGVHFAAEAGEGNVVVSPASIAVALALLAEGADGQTQTALDEVLGAAGQERTAAFSALQDAALAYDGDPCLVQAEELPERPLLNLANGITADEARPLEQEYLHALARAYGAGVRTADFAGGKGKPVLDAWVDAHTGGLIEESAIDPDADTAFVLQNAVLMAARWRSPFAGADTRESPFATASGAVLTPATMHQTLTAGYVEDGGMQAIRLPYTEAFAMDVVLPAEDTSPGDLSAEEWTRISEALGSGNADTEVALALPKLSFRSSTALDEAFRTIGLGPMYSPGSLDGITPGVFVSQSEHRAVLRVDEEGTVAAAVTEIMAALSAVLLPPVEMTVNRPFALRIVDVETGWPLFHAVVNDPEG
ncbi:serpin family protein [Brevibacterium sp.]|uniref:serpin family protein n=1 Tax=Brevibacterium sp. TaxID=1701 RepID=UPI0025C08EB6|nr:serpin family protein [Brevibacterium sp.]